MIPYTTPASDFYTLFQISPDASPSDIKIAYHRTLLRLHPDKQFRLRNHGSTASVIPLASDGTTADPTRSRSPEAASVDMALLKEAYRTLSDVGLRAAYDRSLLKQAKEYEHEHARSRGPRPAQVVSLEDFTVVEAVATETASDVAWREWRYRCRCGGMYRIAEGDLENGTHLVCCESCSEVIWVGYEEVVVEEEEDG